MPKRKPQFGQVWLAKLSHNPNNPEYLAVVKITSGRLDKEISFRELESETPFESIAAANMNVFELLKFVK